MTNFVFGKDCRRKPRGETSPEATRSRRGWGSARCPTAAALSLAAPREARRPSPVSLRAAAGTSGPGPRTVPVAPTPQLSVSAAGISRSQLPVKIRSGLYTRYFVSHPSLSPVRLSPETPYLYRHRRGGCKGSAPLPALPGPRGENERRGSVPRSVP